MHFDRPSCITIWPPLKFDKSKIKETKCLLCMISCLKQAWNLSHNEMTANQWLPDRCEIFRTLVIVYVWQNLISRSICLFFFQSFLIQTSSTQKDTVELFWRKQPFWSEIFFFFFFFFWWTTVSKGLSQCGFGGSVIPIFFCPLQSFTIPKMPNLLDVQLMS